jgi:exonuclease SbcD
MSNRPFRFVHAADLHLEEVPRGVAHVPTHLTDLFLQSPYRAAERVFEAACSEHADFLVISGDLLDPARTGPRGPLFLVEQCEKLAARGIAVYWAGGAVDSPDAWPPSVHLPDNVVVFPVGRPEEVVFSRQSEPVARLLGASRTQGRRLRPNEYAAEPGGLFTVAVTHGGADPNRSNGGRSAIGPSADATNGRRFSAAPRPPTIRARRRAAARVIPGSSAARWSRSTSGGQSA